MIRADGLAFADGIMPDLDMSAVLKPPARMTVAEFLEWPGDSTGALWQLVDGEPTAMAPASDRHGTIQINLGFLLKSHLRQHRPGCRAVSNPGIVPRVGARSNVRVPDLAVTCKPTRADTPLVTDPVLAVELLSPSNYLETWSNLWTYTSIPALSEILVVSTTSQGAEVLRRHPDGSWPADFERISDPDALVRLDSIGAAFPLRAFYEDTDLA